MLHRFTGILENLVVYEDNMLKNVNLYGGIVFSQKVLLELVNKGYTREEAYKIVQKHALDALNGGNFKEGLLDDERVMSKLSKEDLQNCFNMNDYLKHINDVFQRF